MASAVLALTTRAAGKGTRGRFGGRSGGGAENTQGASGAAVEAAPRGGPWGRGVGASVRGREAGRAAVAGHVTGGAPSCGGGWRNTCPSSAWGVNTYSFPSDRWQGLSWDTFICVNGSLAGTLSAQLVCWLSRWRTGDLGRKEGIVGVPGTILPSEQAVNEHE